jgi:ABC-type multidrug transport system permease subunit
MPAEDLKYFADIYRKLDPGTHPQEIQNIIEDWSTRFQNSPDYQTYVQDPLSSGEVTGDRSTQRNPTSPVNQRLKRHPILPWRQLGVLSQRHFRLIWRDRPSLILSLLTGPIGIALVWLGVQGKTPLIASTPSDLQQASLALRVVFIFSCVAIWVGLSSAVQEIVKEAAIYVRERLVNLGILPYIGSKVLVRLGIALVQTLLITGAIALGFASPESELLPWWLGLGITTFLTLLSSLCLGLMLSAFVRNATAANSALPLVMIPQIIFSGVLFDLKGIADWISNGMPSRWSVAAYAALVNVNKMIPTLPANPKTPALQGTLASNPAYAATWNNLAQNWSMLVLHALLYWFITLYLQRRKDIY